MLPSPACPRAGQSGSWQNRVCGSIGASPGARFGDHARRDARWTRVFQVVTTVVEPGTIDLRFRGDSEFTDEGADELDERLASLGPHATEPAVFTGEYDGELRVIPLDPADWSPAAPAGIPILGTVR